MPIAAFTAVILVDQTGSHDPDGNQGWDQSHPSHVEEQWKTGQCFREQRCWAGKNRWSLAPSLSDSHLFSPTLPLLPASLPPRPGPRLLLIPRLPQTVEDTAMSRRCHSTGSVPGTELLALSELPFTICAMRMEHLQTFKCPSDNDTDS